MVDTCTRACPWVAPKVAILSSSLFRRTSRRLKAPRCLTATMFPSTANLVIVVIPGVLAAPAAHSGRKKIRNDDADALFEGERWVGMAHQPSSILHSGGDVGLSAQSRATSAYLEAEAAEIGDRKHIFRCAIIRASIHMGWKKVTSGWASAIWSCVLLLVQPRPPCRQVKP